MRVPDTTGMSSYWFWWSQDDPCRILIITWLMVYTIELVVPPKSYLGIQLEILEMQLIYFWDFIYVLLTNDLSRIYILADHDAIELIVLLICELEILLKSLLEILLEMELTIGTELMKCTVPLIWVGNPFGNSVDRIAWRPLTSSDYRI